MSEAQKFELFIRAMLTRIPPGEAALVTTARLMSQYHDRVISVAVSPFNPNLKRQLLDGAASDLLRELQELCEPELPYVPMPELDLPTMELPSAPADSR